MVEIKIPRGYRVLIVLIAMLAAACTWVWARSAASVQLAPTAVLRVDTGHPENAFDPGAVGLSIEASELRTGHFNADYYRLVRLMRLLGPSVLRIGGNSVDLSWWTSNGELPPPWATSTVTPSDLYAVAGLMHATGWRVLLGVNLGHFEPTRAANEARNAQEILGANLVGIEIGNEPNFYGTATRRLRPPSYNVSDYVSEAEVYRQVLVVAVPGVAIYGPVFSGTGWLARLGTAAKMYSTITQHYYPMGDCPGSSVPPANVSSPTASELLSPASRQSEDETLAALARVRALAGRPTLIGETNDVACSGGSTVGPAFASALWALDWSLRAASSGVMGMNFFSQLGPCGSRSDSPICAPDVDAAHAGDVTAQAEYYGLLAASRLEGGRFVPTHLIDPDPLANLTTWATLARDGTLRLAIDNLATEGLAQPVSIPMSGYTATKELLGASSVEARGGIALGGSPVTGEGQWRPRPTRLLRVGHSLRVVLPPASAVIVILHRTR